MMRNTAWMKKLLPAAGLIIFFGCMTSGCSKNAFDPATLKDQICTGEVLNCHYDDGTVLTSTVKAFNVLSSRTTSDHDTSELEVVLEDDLIERTLYITAETSKYEQGWLLDGANLNDSSFRLIGEISQDFIAEKIAEDENASFGQGNFTNYRELPGTDKGFQNLTLLESSTEDQAYLAKYEVKDSYPYVDISGTIDVRVDVRMNCDFDGFYIYRDVSSDTAGVVSDWHDIYGTYKLSTPYSEQQLEQYITVAEDHTVTGYREYIGAIDGQRYHEDLTGRFEEANHSTAVVTVVDDWSHIENIIFTPEDIEYRYLMPNGSDFDTGYDFSKVVYERIS